MKRQAALLRKGKRTYAKAFIQEYQGCFSAGKLDGFLYKKTASTLFKWLEMILQAYPQLSKKQMDYALVMAKHILKYSHIPKEESAQLMGTFLYHYYPLLEAKFDGKNGRFGNHVADKYGRIRIRLVWIWFKCWVAHTKQTHRLFKSEHYDYWITLKEQPFQKIIRYLPNFIWLDMVQKISIFSREVILHLGQGGNPRGVFTFFSKRMAHEFTNLTIDEYLHFLAQYNRHQAPNMLSFYCYIKSIKQNLAFFKLIANHIQTNQDIDIIIKKWKTPIQKLVEWNVHQLRRDEQQSLLGYIAHGMQDIENFSLKGRTLQSTRRLATLYYEELQQAALQQNRRTAAEQAKWLATQTWAGASYQEWNLFEKGTWYAIFQLTSRQALNEESAKMMHCVHSYANYCIQGTTSIWSLRMKSKDDFDSWIPLVTIEVNSDDEIIQAKMKYNGLPTDDLLAKINDWVEKEGLVYLSS